jgi:hypothetical protein
LEEAFKSNNAMLYPEYRVKEVPLDVVDRQVLKGSKRAGGTVMKWVRIIFLAIFGLYGLMYFLLSISGWSFFVVPAFILIIWISLEIKGHSEESLLDLDIKKGTKQVLEGYVTKKTITRVQEHTLNTIGFRYDYHIEVGPRQYKVTQAAFERLREGQPIILRYMRLSQHVLGMSFPDSLEPVEDTTSGTKANLPDQPS